MRDLANGMLVKHQTLGLGKIVALEPNAVHVFFPESDKRFAAKLRLPAARTLLATEGLEPNAWLEGLSAFTLDGASGRYALAASWLTHDQAIAQFLAIFPKGFLDPAYVGGEGAKGDRASRWRAAHDAWVKAFADGQGEKLLEADDLKELTKRVLSVEKIVAPLHPPADKDALKTALGDEETARAFFGALVELLSVPSPGRARFEKLFGTAGHLPVAPAQQWLVATLFPFIASPERHVLMRPKATREAAERLGCDLRYEDSPTWVSYAALRTLSTQLLEKLEPNGAKDFVDVESFLHVTAAAKRAAKSEDGAAPSPKRARARETRARSTP
jgi:hypothetical protein